MKSKLFFISLLFCGVLFVSCGEDEVSANSSINSDGELSGTIANTTLLPNDSVYFYGPSDVLYGKAPVDSKGAFKVKLSTPESTNLSTLKTSSDYDLKISDEKLKITVISFSYYVSEDQILTRANVNPTLEAESISATLVETAFYYADRDATVTFTGKDDEDDVKIDMKLKKGWNEVANIAKITTSSYSEEITTTIPSGLKWWYAEYDESDYDAAPKSKITKAFKGLLK
ncbi:MAG: hypothetical protein H6Q20_1130 [Bacteroidetes bacterium]|jgi:hypothetical protein|nr:hypothetical protein [Bacteroidota bacterium]